MSIIIVTVLVEGPSLPAELKGTETPFTIIDSGFFEAVGVISFAYVCHHNTLLIYGSLVTPTIDRWNKVTHISMGISVIASLVMATSGYFIFVSRKSRLAFIRILKVGLDRRTKHAATSSIISQVTVSSELRNVCVDELLILLSADFWANVARLCFGLNMMTTTPLEAFVCREVRLFPICRTGGRLPGC